VLAPPLAEAAVDESLGGALVGDIGVPGALAEPSALRPGGAAVRAAPVVALIAAWSGALPEGAPVETKPEASPVAVAEPGVRALSGVVFPPEHAVTRATANKQPRTLERRLAARGCRRRLESSCKSEIGS
jgi:hypothetical protein